MLRVKMASMAAVLQPAAAVLQPVASVLEKAHHYSKPALSPTFVNVFIPLSAALGLIFAIWYAASSSEFSPHLLPISEMRLTSCPAIVLRIVNAQCCCCSFTLSCGCIATVDMPCCARQPPAAVG